jgi:hypothetical protein
MSRTPIEHEHCDCRSGTGECAFCQPAEEDQAEDGADERKKSEREFIVAENCDGAALDDQNSGAPVEGQGMVSRSTAGDQGCCRTEEFRQDKELCRPGMPRGER